MISAIRRRHLRVWVLLAIAVPILLWFALRARPTQVRNEAIPDGVERSTDDTRPAAADR